MPNSAKRAVSRRATRRAEILRISGRIFREKTYDGTTLKDIADAVGMLKGSLYYYISSKEELFSDIIVEAVRVLHRSLEGVNPEWTPVEKLRYIVRTHVRFSVEYQDTAILFLTGRHIISSLRMNELADIFGRRDKIIADTLKDGIAQGVFGPANVRLVALSIVGMCNSVAFWYTPEGTASHQQIADQFFKLIYEGLQTRPN
jgi:TetR/AcrR family transcriptional regulator, cholesterol catabolism regulator